MTILVTDLEDSSGFFFFPLRLSPCFTDKGLKRGGEVGGSGVVSQIGSL